jgi:hypothetical protein
VPHDVKRAQGVSAANKHVRNTKAAAGKRRTGFFDDLWPDASESTCRGPLLGVIDPETSNSVGMGVMRRLDGGRRGIFTPAPRSPRPWRRVARAAHLPHQRSR